MPAFSHSAAGSKGRFIQTSLRIGKYLVSPSSRCAGAGRFTAAVSIRSGQGSMTHDRVVRFVPLFDTHTQATDFATEQAMAWIGRPLSSADPFINTQD